MRMDICLCSDENYAKYMGTTIASILSNSKEDEELYFHLIVDNDVTDSSKEKLLSLKKIKNCEMIFYTPDVEKYKEWHSEINGTNRFTAAMFYRLDVHRLIPDIDKILYLDCDIVVRNSLKEIFEIDIECYDALIISPYADKHYFNSGVMMINSKLWREKNIEIEFQECFIQNKNIIVTDENILNITLKNRVKHIDIKFNYTPLKSSFYINDYKIEDIVIIHYAIYKPWGISGKVFLFVDEFWKYYQLTPWFLERPIDAIQTILAQKYSDYEETKLKINDIRFFGIYHNRNILEIVIFFIKIKIEMNFNNINKIAWFIPVKKWREAFKRAFDI